MPILNYTTEITVDRTVGEIQKLLAGAGATAVLTEYAEGHLAAISFRILYEGAMVTFRLPARIDPIYVLLQNDDSQRMRKAGRKYRSRDQAARVAWRIVKDWIEAQLAMVEAEQAEIAEVFLPYAQDPETGQTLFERVAAGGFRLLKGPA